MTPDQLGQVIHAAAEELVPLHREIASLRAQLAEAQETARALSLQLSENRDTLDTLGSAYGSESERADQAERREQDALGRVAAMADGLRQAGEVLKGYGPSTKDDAAWNRVVFHVLAPLFENTAQSAAVFGERVRAEAKREEAGECARIAAAYPISLGIVSGGDIDDLTQFQRGIITASQAITEHIRARHAQAPASGETPKGEGE